MNITPLHFAHPEWVGILWGWLALVVVLVVLERRGSDALDRLVGLALQGRLVDRPSRWRRFTRIVLLGVAGAAMSIALMQPQWGERYVATPRVGAEIMIALDVSRSMLADDTKPSRLERAKAEIRDLLSYLGDDYVGLIAFAGRASVLSPMTPDKSFLRLALDGAGPHSVTRGGTRLAEPIRRAVAGLGEPGPAQRALILITDGEDHDSFALDAAKAAAEAGIKIIAIGFGDENGSPVYVRDARSGARAQVRDSDGQPVISRLNGELLRELALITDGAFVPAGTGVLDLASIYEAHIARLTRGQLDERGRTIRDEVYQIFLVVAFVCLIAAVGVTTGRTRGAASAGAGSGLALLLGLALVGGSSPAQAQLLGSPDPQSPVAATADDSLADPLAGVPSPDSPASSESAEDPRTKFNRANEALARGDGVSAGALLRGARRDARDDVELRYAATFNLGMAAIARADAQAADNPREALAALHEAADWFREASSARPDESDPRHNLDVTLRRALILADELARTEAGEVEKELDALIEAQRRRVGASAGLLEEVVRGGELDAADRLGPAFRDAATEQRLLLSQADELAERITRERDAIAAQPEESRAPEDALRSVQLDGALVYLDASIDRMGQTRRQLRQRRAERSYRRGSAALGELKRARDQLRDPVQQIGVLLQEVGGIVGATNALAAAGRIVVPLASPSPSGGIDSRPRGVPAFLTAASLEEESRRLENRVRELGVRLAQAASDAEASASSGAAGAMAPPAVPASPGQPSEADRAALRAALAAAAPLVQGAARSMERATSAVAGETFDLALRGEAEARQLLADAQEGFFDLRQLLDVAYADESRIADLAGSAEEEIVGARDEYVPLLRELQAKNVERVERSVGLLEREREKRAAELEARLAQSAEGDAATQEEADPRALEKERFDLAEALRAMAEAAMLEAGEALARDAGGALEWPVVAETSGRARDHLDAIRTLFFTLVEHVRKLTQDQIDTSDSTQDAIALAESEGVGSGEDLEPTPGDDPEGESSRGPQTRARARELTEDQAGLEARAGVLADALLAQSEKLAASESGGVESGPAAGEEAAPERLRRAAEHLVSGQLMMREAGETLADDQGPLAPAHAAQGVAIEELQAALALLSPPPQDREQGEEPEQEDQEGGESEPEPQEGQDESASVSENQQAQEEQPEGDPSQLLQGVRDREAERRRERERDQERRRSQPVDKDW